MAQDSVRGYVVGQDTIDGQPVWKVRASKDDPKLKGAKFKVLSMHPESAELSPGCDVEFETTTHKGITVAANVRVVNQPVKAPERPAQQKDESEESINLAALDFNGKLLVNATGFDSFREARKDFAEESSGEEILLDLIRIRHSDLDCDDFRLDSSGLDSSAFQVIANLLYMDGDLRNALEGVLSLVFRAGYQAGKEAKD